MIKAITMPKWGLSMTEGVVGDWLVAEGAAVQSGTEVVLVETEKIAGGVEAADAGTVRRAVAVSGDTLPVGALLGVLAGDEIPDAEIDAFVRQFQENFVPEEAGEEELGDQTETVQVGELSINYLRQGSAERTAVLLHGFGGDLDNWLFNHLALSSNRTVIAVDLPGHGRSTKEVGDGSFAFMADVLHDTMRELDVAEADWVGHSMGGAIALQLARSHPQLVRSLTLLASAGLGPEINTDYLQGFTRSRTRRELKPHVQQLFADASLVTRQLVADLLKYKRLDGVQESLEALAYQLGDHGAQAEVSRQVIDAVPTLVIWGADDRIIPASHARDLPNQDNVHIFDNTGHMVQMERASEVNRLITAFWNAQD
jgi:pyruvate dehydrogenase E2 component (dihydrolipoamide acetyltransferase)